MNNFRILAFTAFFATMLSACMAKEEANVDTELPPSAPSLGTPQATPNPNNPQDPPENEVSEPVTPSTQSPVTQSPAPAPISSQVPVPTITMTPAPINTPQVTAPGVNLSLGKNTSQRSTTNGGEPSRAVDGNTDGTWRNNSVTHTAAEDQPWWQVDLSAVEFIDQINIFNRTDCCEERLSNFYVLVSDNTFNGDDLESNLNQASVQSYYAGSAVDGSVSIDVGHTGRYVRIQLAGTGNALSLAEVEVISGQNPVLTPTPIVTAVPEPTSTPVPPENPISEPTIPEPNVTPEPVATPESVATPDPELIALYEFGAEVYAEKCEQCHEPLEVSRKRFRTREDIAASIINVQQMRNITLNDAELDGLTYVLNNVHPLEAENVPPVSSGEVIFEQQCSSCHGEDAQPLFPLFVQHTDLESITEHTETTMPPGNPGSCIDDCASAVAEYIFAEWSGGVDGETVDTSTELGTQRLKRLQYYATLEQLISPYGMSVNNLTHPDDPVVGGFEAGTRVDSTLVFTYHTNASIVARELVEKVEENSNLINCNDLTDECIRTFYLLFAEQAYRRPLLDGQIDLLNAIYDAESDDMLVGLGSTIGFILQSPSFLYHLNLVDDPSDYTLANRLSYLLWNQPPDGELLMLADQNALRNPAELDRQIDRLLDDAKGQATLLDFVTQWLSLESVERIVKDADAAPGFAQGTAETMDRDLMDFVMTSLQQENSFEYLFSADYQLSGELAQALSQWTNTVQTNRNGVLSHPGILASLSGPVERSPILRGAFVMDKLLCDHRPPAANIADLVESIEIPEDATPRERTIALTASPTCQSCHASINTLGFGFENYDGLGLAINESLLENFTVQATERAGSTSLSFNGVENMQHAMLELPQFYDCAVDKAIDYANLISRPSEASADTIYTNFQGSADLKALFKSIALTILDNNE